MVPNSLRMYDTFNDLYNMIVSLFQLPKSVISDLVSCWLSFKEIGRLDSAVCLARVRPLLEESLRSIPLRHTKRDCPLHKKLVLWMVKRKVQLKEVFVVTEFEQCSRDMQRQLFRSSRNTLRAIVVDTSYGYGRTETIILDLCMFATAIEVCIVKQAISEVTAGILLATNKKFRVLFLRSGVGVLNCVSNFSSCAHLTDLTLDCGVSSESLYLFLDLNPPKLQKLCLPECREFDSIALTKLQSLTQLCVLHVAHLKCSDLAGLCYPSIVELKIGLSCYDTQSVVAIAKAFPNVRMLTIGPCDTVLNMSVLLQIIALLPLVRQFTAWSGPDDMDYTDSLTRLFRHTSSDDTTSKLQRLYVNVDPTDFDFEQLAALCPALYDVAFFHMPLIRKTMQSPQATIQRLSAYSQSRITDSNVANICGLQELVLLDCRNLSDAGFIALASNNPQLRVLIVKNVNVKVTYKRLMVFLDLCSLLTSVTFVVDIPSTRVTSCEADAMFSQLCKKSYPNLKHFVCNMV